jgi:hypothetical protein
MLKDGILITKEEANLICAINCDNESGRHLISPRSEEYWNMRVTLQEARLARNTGTANEKQLQMLEFQHQTEDYFYWRNLPDDKKLFTESEEGVSW